MLDVGCRSWLPLALAGWRCAEGRKGAPVGKKGHKAQLMQAEAPRSSTSHLVLRSPPAATQARGLGRYIRAPEFIKRNGCGCKWHKAAASSMIYPPAPADRPSGGRADWCRVAAEGELSGEVQTGTL